MSETLPCPACEKIYVDEVDACEVCHFPFKGTEQEQSRHIGQFINKRGIINDSEAAIRRSKNIIYLMAGFNVLFVAIGILKGNMIWFDGVFNLALAVIFALCGYYVKKGPVLLTTIPLLLIIGVNSMNFIVEPSSIFRGIIFKLIIIGSLAYSIYLVNSAERFRKKYEQ